MLTGEIKVNETLTLLKWKATNEGPADTDPSATRYFVKIEGIDRGHSSYYDKFDVYHWHTNEMPDLIISILSELMRRQRTGLTRTGPMV